MRLTLIQAAALIVIVAELNVQSHIVSATPKQKHRNGSEEATLEPRTEVPQLPGREPLSDLLNPDKTSNAGVLAKPSGSNMLDLPWPPSLSREHREIATREDISVDPQRLAGELPSQETSHEARTKRPTEMSSTEFGEYVRNLKRRPSSASPEQRVAVERMITEAKRARALERSRLRDKPEEEVIQLGNAEYNKYRAMLHERYKNALAGIGLFNSAEVAAQIERIAAGRRDRASKYSAKVPIKQFKKSNGRWQRDIPSEHWGTTSLEDLRRYREALRLQVKRTRKGDPRPDQLQVALFEKLKDHIKARSPQGRPTSASRKNPVASLSGASNAQSASGLTHTSASSSGGSHSPHTQGAPLWEVMSTSSPHSVLPPPPTPSVHSRTQSPQRSSSSTSASSRAASPHAWLYDQAFLDRLNS